MIQPDFYIDPRNGNLIMFLEESERAELLDQIDDNPYWNLFYEVMESHSCNGSYSVFNAGDANPYVGLTDATCIAERLDTDDDGVTTIDGEFWFSENYMIENELEVLAKTGVYVFKLAE